MAKRKVEMQIEDNPSMPMGENGNVLVDADIIEDVQVVDVDANGRKKKVNLSYEELDTKGLKNKSQIIRYLDAEGYSRSAIALFLNVRYQHVRNVLVTPLKKG
jgi:hypothetical protein